MVHFARSKWSIKISNMSIRVIRPMRKTLTLITSPRSLFTKEKHQDSLSNSKLLKPKWCSTKKKWRITIRRRRMLRIVIKLKSKSLRMQNRLVLVRKTSWTHISKCIKSLRLRVLILEYSSKRLKLTWIVQQHYRKSIERWPKNLLRNLSQQMTARTH